MTIPQIEAAFFENLGAARIDEARKNLASLDADAVSASRRHYLEALLCLQEQRYADAVPLLRAAVDGGDASAAMHNNLGVALLREGDWRQASDSFEQALAIDPESEAARYGQVSCLVRSGDGDAAIPAARELCRRYPRSADYVCALADACRLNRKWQQAFRLYRRALRLDHSHTAARLNLIVILKEIGRFARALRHCQTLLEAEPGNVMALQHLGDCHLAMENPDEAMHAYADAFEIEPKNTELCTRVGNAWLDADNHQEAGAWFHRALSLDPDYASARIGLADVLRKDDQGKEALELLLEIEADCIDDPNFLTTLAETYWDEGSPEEALELFRKAQALRPERIALHARIGRVLSSSGDVDGAIDEYRAGLKLNPKNPACLNGLATTVRGKLDPEHVDTMQALLDNKRIRDQARSSLHNGLAFYYEGQKDYGKAAEHSRLANEHQWRFKSRTSWQYDPAEHGHHIDRLISTFDRNYFDALTSLNRSDSRMPVFIVSMPRSGTTLTEQILSRHSKVLGIGECDFAGRGFQAFREALDVRDLNGKTMRDALSHANLPAFSGAHLGHIQRQIDKAGKEGVERVVDKMPDNYHLLGWIKTIFPNARIIHIRRDPRDVALSCWMTQFASITWACQPEHLKSRIADYQRLMKHWRDVLGDDILEIDYEDLVADQETISRKLIDWIDLDWEDACLSFYESDRLVRTASITQVRQPIYSKSVKKWEHYQPWLADLFDGIESHPGHADSG